MRQVLLALIGAWALSLASPAPADEIGPSSRVQRSVVIRSAPSGDAPSMGALRPGETLELIDTVPYWYRVRLPDGSTGFVSQSWTIVEPSQSDAYRVHFVDVGTGLAVFIQGEDFAAVYDAGSNDDIALGDGNRFIAYLRATAPDLTVIDHVILSHPHRDHVELLPDVLRRYDVRNVWDSGRTNDTCGYRYFLEAVIGEPDVAYHDALGNGEAHVAAFPIQTCYGRKLLPQKLSIPEAEEISDAVVQLGAGARMRFLYADGKPHPSPNENSLVVLLELGDVRILLMGDAEAGGRKRVSDNPRPNSIEGRLLACCVEDLVADVLVVGHHGSTTSSRSVFLDATESRTFVVSSGPFRYSGVRLPDDAVIDALSARGAVWRTDFDDVACANTAAKIGADSDNEPGGCDNVVLETDGRTFELSYQRLTD